MGSGGPYTGNNTTVRTTTAATVSTSTPTTTDHPTLYCSPSAGQAWCGGFHDLHRGRLQQEEQWLDPLQLSSTASVLHGRV